MAKFTWWVDFNNSAGPEVVGLLQGLQPDPGWTGPFPTKWAANVWLKAWLALNKSAHRKKPPNPKPPPPPPKGNGGGGQGGTGGTGPTGGTGGTGGNPPGQPVTTGPGSNGVTPLAIWRELEAQGATPVQAAGIMGNMINESGLNPEKTATDSNGATSYGLVMWNAKSYPDAHSLVTGHPLADLRAQIRFLAQTGGFKAARGTTPQAAASSFAQTYERCASCQPGGASNAARQASAVTVAGWAQSDSWPASVAGATDNATLGASLTAADSASCFIGFSGSVPVFGFGVVGLPGPTFHQSINVCALSNSQARAIESVGLFLAGGIVMFAGLGFLFAATNQQRALQLLQVTPAGRIPGALTRALGTAPPDDQPPPAGGSAGGGPTPPAAPGAGAPARQRATATSP